MRISLAPSLLLPQIYQWCASISAMAEDVWSGRMFRDEHAVVMSEGEAWNDQVVIIGGGATGAAFSGT